MNTNKTAKDKKTKKSDSNAGATSVEDELKREKKIKKVLKNALKEE